MKHVELKVIAHNLADIFTHCWSFLLEAPPPDLYEQLLDSPRHAIVIDFLNGTLEKEGSLEPVDTDGEVYQQACADLCKKHGVPLSSFNSLLVRYWLQDGFYHARVMIVDSNNRSSTSEYWGSPMRRRDKPMY
jgi:transposase-like protein